MKGSQTTLDHKANIVDKLHALDFMLSTLEKVAKDDGDKAEELVKKISTRKLILVDELFKLISPLS